MISSMLNLKKLQDEATTSRHAPDMPLLATQNCTVPGVAMKQKVSRIKGKLSNPRGGAVFLWFSVMTF